MSRRWSPRRVFARHDNAAPPMRIETVRARDPAARDRATVFCSPMATFASNRGATMANMKNGLAISVDNADPRAALRVLRAVHGLGEPTVVVNTGSV